MNDLLSIKEACTVLETSKATLYRYIRSGNVPVVRIFGRAYVKRNAINTILTEGTSK
jgi:excisionase family DNA binding protein